MKKVLLTGATGFIGRHCIPLLQSRGYEVHAVSSQALIAVTAAPSAVHWHQANLLDAAAVSALVPAVAPTHLLHFAWIVEPGVYWTSRENFAWVQSSLHLLRAFGECGGQRVVMAGTCAEYDWRYGYCSENMTPLQPTTTYGTCKHALQLLLATFASQSQLSAAWGRIFSLYGPGEQPQRLVAGVINSLLRDQPARCSHGEQIRDFLYVKDVADALVALLESSVTGPVNIASGQPIKLSQVLATIGHLTGKSDLIRLGARDVSPDEPDLLVAKVHRLRDEVGWVPQYDLEQGLRQTLDWWTGHNAASGDAGRA